MRRIAAPLGLTTVVAALLLGGVASADAGPSRTEYAAQLEAICKPRALATEGVTEGSREDINAGRLASAAKKFGRATRIYAATLRIIAPVPRPRADVRRLSKWFSYLKRQESYLREITTELRARNSIRAQRLTALFIHNGNLANNAVLDFDFDYCSFKFSRFG
jgi:hypothetical protein